MFNQKSSICDAIFHVTDAFVGGNDIIAGVISHHFVLGIDLITHGLSENIK